MQLPLANDEDSHHYKKNVNNYDYGEEDDQESSFIHDNNDKDSRYRPDDHHENTLSPQVYDGYNDTIPSHTYNDNEYDDEDQKEGVAVHRHLNFDDEKDDALCDDDDDFGEGNDVLGTGRRKVDDERNHWRRDVENPPPQDDEMSRKYDRAPSTFTSVKRSDSPDSLEDIGHSSIRTKGRKGEQDGRTGESRVMSVVNVAWLPTRAWFGEVWRDLTVANASKCSSEAKMALEALFQAKNTWSQCLHYLLVGLIMSFICEVVSQGPQYNTALLLVLIAGFEFNYFPSKSVRPQLVLSVLVGVSIALDIMLFAQPPHKVNDGAKVLTSIVLLSKGLALYNFLCLSSTGSRAKKYLWRRIRVFFIPLSYPRKPMREIRSRILAVEWLQAGVAIGYIVLFVFGFMAVGVSDVMSSPSAGMPLVAFLPIKFLTSSAITMVLMIDTDITLCFAYFGCLGGMMSYVKAYIHSKQQEYGGWPLSYALNPYRVYAVAVLKFVDVCFGFAGWAAVGTTFSAYYSLGYNVMALVSGTVTMLVLSDIWIPILFVFVIRMIRKHDALVRRLQESEESDDSELDEFDIRNNEKAINNGREMRYRSLNQGFLKPFKSKYSIGSASSSDGDYESSSSDEESGKRRKKKKNRNKGGVTDAPDDNRSKASHAASLNIDVSLAMGSDEEDNDDNDDDDEEKSEGDEEIDDQSNRLTSPGPLPGTLRSYAVQQPLESPVPGLVSPNVVPAAHGWGRHNKVAAAAFSPGKGSWGQATTDASQILTSSHTTDGNTEAEKLPPRPQLPMKLPPLESSSQGFSSPEGKVRPPFVPRLHLAGAVHSPGANINDQSNIDSDTEYTFDSPYQPKIRTKTGTPIQKQGLKPLPPVGSRPQVRPPEHAKPTHRNLERDDHITIEEATTISPDRYTEMWDEMEVSASFSAQLYPENDIINEKLVQLVSHLQRENFFVVAAGEADHVITIYGFASGFKKCDPNASSDDKDLDGSMRLGVSAVYFLMELKIHTDSSLHPQGLWSFECNCKCSSPPSNPVFIKMMLLGDCLQLVKK
mmetsp:Transcript_6775/g.13033  ORF Transcript_6775/g.13033 Transcript_6775/m.13033 type:complete len:1043 (+) Transcript_6775:153-3281(+)